MNNNSQKKKRTRQYKTIECPYCGGELLSSAKKCKHCGELLSKNGQNISDEENIGNELSLWPHIANIGGYLCYIFGAVDYVLGSLGIVDLTGFSWSPVLFTILGILLQALAKTLSD